MRGGTFNLSFVFWIWLISIFILGLKIKSASGFNIEVESETEAERLRIPALGRISYGIGSLYDGRTGNFLPLDFSVISEKSPLRRNSKIMNRKTFLRYSDSSPLSVLSPSDKLSVLFESPKSIIYDRETGMLFYKNYDGLALRAVLGMLEFPENGTGGFLLDKITQLEMTETSPAYVYSLSYSFEDELVFPGKKPDPKNFLNMLEDKWSGPEKKPNPQDLDVDKNAKILRREIRRNLKRADIKILKKATHVVVKVIGGSTIMKSTSRKNNQFFSDGPILPANESARGTSPTDGVPLHFELMPLLQFLNETGLKLTPSSQNKFIGLEDSNWRNPMEILHGQTFKNLDLSWQLIRQITKLNTTFHQCLEENPKKEKKRGEEMIQDLQNLYENFTVNLAAYKSDLKSLLEKSSTGTEQDEKLWNSIYVKEWRAVGTGIHWDFYRVLEAAQKKIVLLRGKNNIGIYSDSKYLKVINGKKNGVKIECDAIFEIV